MRRAVTFGGAALGVLGAALLASRRSAVEPAPAAAERGRPAPAAVAHATSAPLPVVRGRVASTPHTDVDRRGAPVDARAPQAGEGPRGSVAVRALESFSADELALFARFERLTGRPAPPALLDLAARRRAGASPEELVALATRAFQGDLLGRAAALEWIDAAGSAGAR